MVSSPVKRVSIEPLDGSFGPDRGRRIVVSFVPGKEGVADLLQFRPLGTRRPESIAVIDAYRFALRCRVTRGQLEKARARKEAKSRRLAAQRQARAEKRLVES